MGVIGELSNSSHNMISAESLAFDIFSSKDEKQLSPPKSTQFKDFTHGMKHFGKPSINQYAPIWNWMSSPLSS